MTSELCPKCGHVRELARTSTVTEETQPNGSLKTIRTDAFHCSACRTFVRSEAHETATPKGREA